MNQFRPKGKKVLPMKVVPVIVMAIFFGGVIGATSRSLPPKQLETFSSPAEAFKTLVEAIATVNESQMVALLGPYGKAFLSAEARLNGETLKQFLKEYGEEKRLEKIGQYRVVLHVGSEDWPWPIPVVKAGMRWRFDIERGKKEILARRIGGNETSAVQVCLAYVDAQREYSQHHRTAKGLMEYAKKFVSDDRKENGLCWLSEKDRRQSPLGPLLANACETSYSSARSKVRPAPYFGYYYKILTRQGKDAPGGVYNYIVDGSMIGGFALVAYPASYGMSGIMTFIVNQDGLVYQKDLGKKTERIVRAMKEFNPDRAWVKVD
jgi:Protein of unknown function (DUF2950)